MKILSIFLGLLLLCCFGCISGGPRKTKWTVAEVREWYPACYEQEHRKFPHHAWDGILYQGSDDHWHHFVGRVLSVDDWAIIRIKKEELALADERLYLTISSGRLGYYFVDPIDSFKKIRDYQ